MCSTGVLRARGNGHARLFGGEFYEDSSHRSRRYTPSAIQLSIREYEMCKKKTKRNAVVLKPL